MRQTFSHIKTKIDTQNVIYVECECHIEIKLGDTL